MRALAALSLALVVGCNTVFPTAKSQCVAACERIDELGCIEKKLIPTCVDTCLVSVEYGIWDPVCVMNASSKESLKPCRVRCKQ